MVTLKLKKVINVLSLYRPINLICRCNLFRVQIWDFHIFFSTSEDDYDYLFYQEILLNSGESTSENVTVKDPL